MILDDIEKLYTADEEAIEQWLAQRRAEAPPPITCSVDIRHSGMRAVPVDNNLYPAGFNNLSPAGAKRAARFFQHFMEERFPHAKRVLIIPENHTRNLPYFESLSILQRLLTDAGLEARLGKLTPEAHGETLARHQNVLALENGFTPDVILLNNDCTAGPPPILAGLAQPILPPVWMGWYRRRKSQHFNEYKTLVNAFAAAFGIDPWLISAHFHACGQIDFKAHQGIECVAQAVEDVLAMTREKYAQYNIKEEPYVFVKADGGTYGMGIMTVKSGEEMLNLNKKNRNKMQVVKEGARVSEVIVQEGVPTIDTVEDHPAEPMMYLIDGIPAGGMYRVNAQRDAFTNLNATGMTFTGMCDETEPPCNRQPVRACNFRAFGLIAALSALAAGQEMRRQALQEAA